MGSTEGRGSLPTAYQSMGGGDNTSWNTLSDATVGRKVKKRSTLLSVTTFIILTEFCERLAYYGFAGSLVLLFDTELGFTNAEADTQYSLWSGVCFVTPLLGGWIADSYLGRYNTILISSLLYMAGLVVAAVSCVPGSVSPTLVFSAMYILALSTGGIKSSVSVFGADQFDEDDPQDMAEKASFFNWFYWGINLGAIVSFTLVSYVCQYGLPFLGGKDWGFTVGYSIPCVTMALAVAIFLVGTPRYRILPPTGSVVGRALGVVKEAAWTRGGAGADRASHWLQRASAMNGGSYPDEEVAAVGRVLSLLSFLILQVPSWAVNALMSTAFQNQGCQMDLTIGSFKIPVSTLNMFDTISIVALIPLFDRVIFPALRRRGSNPTMLRKIGAGMIFAIMAVLVAAAVEVVRKDMVVGEGSEGKLSSCRRERDYDPHQYQAYFKSGGESYKPAYCTKVTGCDELGPGGDLLLMCIVCEDRPLSSELNILWQIPQFLLIGTSEILTSVTSIEFFYSEAPSTMKGVSAGLNLFITALGYWAIMPLIKLVNSGAFGNPWVPDNLNAGSLELFFLLVAFLVFASFAAFVVVSMRYTYQGKGQAPTLPPTCPVESSAAGLTSLSAPLLGLDQEEGLGRLVESSGLNSERRLRVDEEGGCGRENGLLESAPLLRVTPSSTD